MQVRTQDDAGRWFAPETLSARQHMTPEGFLLCESVPIARTGTLIYDESEILGKEGPLIEGGAGGQVVIERNPDEVFRAETLGSFEGKPVTLSHPDDFVNPSNWRQLSVGITQNVRRGTDVESDLVLADLLITDAAAIEEVRGGLRQVSCGYDADYEQLAPGRGRQTNIVGNHVALVERGRCGPRCAIGDSEPMSKNKRSFADRLRAAFMSKDAAAAEELAQEAEVMDEDGEEDLKDKAKTGDAAALGAILTEVRALSARVGDMEAKLEEKTEDEEPDEEVETADDILGAEPAKSNPQAAGEKYTGDSAALIDLRSRAEILAPGITFGTRDGKTKVADHLCACQRQALTKAMATDAGKAAVEPFLSGRALDQLTSDQVAAAFTGASELVKARNNDKGAPRGVATAKDFGKTTSVADINRRNREHWAGSARN
ncbi:hypothetical protein SAMN04244579_02709 [Azotobacter beijerinckii]|uniref:DUF2213 domain-containing protein n=1 Tax=Azotobacter beijerinckii TaxID=170623 RepID=A0A1H6VDT1_9GAMM|nr:DUF2213 domain-containing protein [Azotobacter beijerinckii]SEI98770.1 hypothetical protein SAMN04244579_02709 [Azotobacter beijerinckii]